MKFDASRRFSDDEDVKKKRVISDAESETTDDDDEWNENGNQKKIKKKKKQKPENVYSESDSDSDSVSFSNFIKIIFARIFLEGQDFCTKINDFYAFFLRRTSCYFKA